MSEKRRKNPFWERAYKGHAYWQGKAKLGRVTLAEEGRYSWHAAGRGGVADDLDAARRAVEAAVAMADRQLNLFGGQ